MFIRSLEFSRKNVRDHVVHWKRNRIGLNLEPAARWDKVCGLWDAVAHHQMNEREAGGKVCVDHSAEFKIGKK